MGMAVQTNYGYGSAKGVPGGLYDLSAHEVSTRQAEGGNLSFGLGVVIGTNKGLDVKIPESDAAGNSFEGVVVHDSVMAEMDMAGKVVKPHKATVGCLHNGKVWVVTGANAEPGYKERVYLITDGDEAGKFTTSGDTATKVEVNGFFLGKTDDGIANAEFLPGMVAAAVN